MKECSKCKRCFGDHNEVCDLDRSLLKQTLAGSPIIADKYRLDQRIGAGALGITYLGYDIKSRRSVGIKMILNDYVEADPACVPVFFQEVETAAAIDHPFVVRIYDYGRTTQEYLFIVMEYLDGPSLKKVLKEQGTISIERAINITCGICEAVAAAHKNGQLHRDLKPANVVVLPPGTEQNPSDTEIVKVVDFGLSRIKTPEMLGVLPANKSQTILGTPFYASPEHCEGEDLDERSEVYSIGIILYHLLTGEPPFKGPTYPAVLDQHVNLAPRGPRLLRPELAENVEEVALRAIEKDPNRRFQSVLAFANLLRQSLKQPGRRLLSIGATRSMEEMPRNLGAETKPNLSLRVPSVEPLLAPEALAELQKQDEKVEVINKIEEEVVKPPVQEIPVPIPEVAVAVDAPKPTRRLKSMRRTQPVPRMTTVESAQQIPTETAISRKSQDSEPVTVAPTPVPPPPPQPLPPPVPMPEANKVASGRIAPVQNTSNSSLSDDSKVAASKAPKGNTNSPLIDPTSPLNTKPLTDTLAKTVNKSLNTAATRTKLPPPPPHEDKPEHYQKRVRISASTNIGETANKQAATSAEIGASCLIEPHTRPVAGIKPVALSPSSIIYLFPDQFLPPKKLRQYKREMHNFFVVERESLAALLLAVAIFSLRRRNSLKLSPVSTIVPLLRRKLQLSEDEQLVLQLINGTVKPLDVLEQRILQSLGKLNSASLQAVYKGFVTATQDNRYPIATAELLNDTVADELVEYKLIDRTQKRRDIPSDPGESDHSYSANDEEIGRYFSQLDDVKQLIESIKQEPQIILGTKKVQIFSYLFDYYRELFRQHSQTLIVAK
ncbi:MAG: serine/threonine-protein kinase [Acidobacteriota bacterium]